MDIDDKKIDSNQADTSSGEVIELDILTKGKRKIVLTPAEPGDYHLPDLVPFEYHVLPFEN